MRRLTVTIEELQKVFFCDAENGALYWKPREIEDFKGATQAAQEKLHKWWNKKYAHQKVMGTVSKGYTSVLWKGGVKKMHQIVWALHHGKMPNDQIDHINGDRSDNRISNLREATQQQNAMNRGADKKSTSKYVGVSWSNSHGKWVAQIQSGKKNKRIGYFRTEIEAAEAYQKEAIALRGEWARPVMFDKAQEAAR
jgi:hypothetical protein